MQSPLRPATINGIVVQEFVQCRGHLPCRLDSRRELIAAFAQLVRRTHTFQQTQARLLPRSPRAAHRPSSTAPNESSNHSLPSLDSARRPNRSLQTVSTPLSLMVKPNPGTFSSRSMISVLRLRLPVEDVPEQFVPDLHIHHRKILRHRRIQAGHHDVKVVHLPGVRNYRNRMRFRKRRDFARLRNAADAVGIELNVVHGARFSRSRNPYSVNSCSPPAMGTRPCDFSSA